MASGDCFEDRSYCDKIFAELAYWQGVVKSNAARFRAILNWPQSKELSIKMLFEDRDCWLYEPTTERAIALTVEQEAGGKANENLESTSCVQAIESPDA
jgi:hypothetical protein